MSFREIFQTMLIVSILGLVSYLYFYVYPVTIMITISGASSTLNVRLGRDKSFLSKIRSIPQYFLENSSTYYEITVTETCKLYSSLCEILA